MDVYVVTWHPTDGDAEVVAVAHTYRQARLDAIGHDPDIEVVHMPHAADEYFSRDVDDSGRLLSDDHVASTVGGVGVYRVSRHGLRGQPRVRPAADLSRDEVLTLLADLGQTVTPGTWSSYVSRGQAPPPVRHVGRTPLWDDGEVRRWAASRPGQGARTDLTDTLTYTEENI